jgi:hypothetical protein
VTFSPAPTLCYGKHNKGRDKHKGSLNSPGARDCIDSLLGLAGGRIRRDGDVDPRGSNAVDGDLSTERDRSCF